MNTYCKAGKVELTEAEAFEIYESKKYIVTSYGIYQPEYHANQPEQRITFRKISEHYCCRKCKNFSDDKKFLRV